MRPQRILTVLGARPQFIKASSVSAALRRAGLIEIVVHTGQHHDPAMSRVFFEELDLPPPAYNLGVHDLPHGAMTGRMLEQIEHVMVSEKPDLALVYGDTNSTAAGALAAAKLNIPVAHVEAGLRSFNRRMPEEINRIVADHLSALLFCPTRSSVDNLAREGITAGAHLVGDVMYDVALATAERAKTKSRILEVLNLEPRTYALATVHRAENTDDPDRFAHVLAWLSERGAKTPIVMPVHPRAAKVMAARGLKPKSVRMIEPLGYLDMSFMTRNAAAVYTDSGGLQKEAYFHRVPCVTLRDETEWVETISAGWNRLWTSSGYESRSEITDYGTGRSSEVIVELLRKI